jgi:hypothetical protein
MIVSGNAAGTFGWLADPVFTAPLGDPGAA